MVTQSFIPVGLQQDLDARIAAAGGDAVRVRREVETEIEPLEARVTIDNPDVMLPLLRGELLYLDSVIGAASAGEAHRGPSLWQRFTHLFKGDKPAVTST